MLKIIDFQPDVCPDCTRPGLVEVGNPQNLVCKYCGVIVSVQIEEDPYRRGANTETFVAEATFIAKAISGIVTQDPRRNSQEAASFVHCPHCEQTGQLKEIGGVEWCDNCGLDPNEIDYPAATLSALWEPDSWIRKFMERGYPKAVPGNLHDFLTTECGPHCPLVKTCAQKRSDFLICWDMFREERKNLAPIDTPYEGLQIVPRRRIKATKKKTGPLDVIYVESTKAHIQFAPSGWYKGKLKRLNETNNPEQSKSTGGRSGA